MQSEKLLRKPAEAEVLDKEEEAVSSASPKDVINDVVAAAISGEGGNENEAGDVPDINAVEGEADDDNDACEPSFFEEEAACASLLSRAAELLPASNEHLLPSVGVDPQGVAALLEIRLPAILDRYQDSPHLLHPHLEALMQPLVALLLRYLPSAAEVWAAETAREKTGAAAGVGAAVSSSEEAASATLAAAADASTAHPTPTLVVTSSLGQDLSMFDSDAPKTPLHVVCKALYSVIKTAGEKCCTSHFPNNVSHYEDVFYTLQLWVADATRQREWEVRYCLLLWLSNLVLVPFSLALVDTHQGEGDSSSSCGDGDRRSDRLSLSDATLVMASRFLADTSKCREAAALLVARLLTRPDSARHRQLFFDFATFLLASSVQSNSEGTAGAAGTTLAASASSAPQLQRVPQDAPWAFLVEGTQTTFNSLLSQPFLLPGVLLAIAKTMKLGRREELVPFAATLLTSVAAVYDQHPGDSLLCKTAVKVGQRLVLSMLKKKRAGWRYRRHIASLSANLALAGPATTTAAVPPSETAEEESRHEPHEEEGEEEMEEVMDGDEESLETGIGLLLQAVGHKDTVVRWSAAKGVGRVCERLPAAFAQEVMEAVLEVFANANSDAHWHGGLLTIAELCRRSLVDTVLLARVVPLVAQGLAYDLSKGTYSVGAHVRDAACYTCWSIARAYDAADLTEHVRQLSVALIVTALFDREVNVRRAAAAAFQECVGRLGNFEHGIELVTTVDFFALATLRHAYTVVAPSIARYPTYRDGMLRELMSVKLLHWDKTIRQMAAVALGLVAAQEPAETVVAEILPELLRRVEDVTVATRHGAILAVAELIRRLPAETTWTAAHIQQFIHILTSLEASRGFRSRGGEYVRQACCAMLQSVAAQRLPLPDTVEVTRVNGRTAKVRTLDVIYSFLRDSWLNILEWVQLAATETFAAVAQTYFVRFLPAFHGKILAELYEGCGGDQPPMRRRGFLSAVGGLPATLVNAPWAPQPSSPPAPPPPSSAEAAEGESGETRLAFESFIPVLQAASLLSPADLANPELADAEARRNAVRALTRVLTLVNAASLPPSIADASRDQFARAARVVTPQWYADIVAGTLMTALQDYATDKRGDVGSFVRLAVLEGLPAVMAFGLQQRQLPPSSPSADSTVTGAPCEASLSLCSAATGLSVLQGVVRCLLEKLDRVRAVAGSVLVTLLLRDRCGELLWKNTAAAQTAEPEEEVGREIQLFTDHLATLTQSTTTAEAIHWHNTQQVMECVGPFVLTRCPVSLAHAGLEGLVVAAGDLSKHVRRPATAAVLAAFHATSTNAHVSRQDNNDSVDARSTDAAPAAAVAQRLSACLIAVLHTHAHEERMLKPACRALDLLINEGVFAVAQHGAVLAILRSELKHFALNIMVLLAMVPLLANVCRSPDGEVRRGAWTLALTMIASRYPKVRAKVATDFYTSLLVLTSDGHSGPGSSSASSALTSAELDGCKRAMEHLTKVAWDGSDAQRIRSARNELYGMLGIEPPTLKGKAGDADDGEARLGAMRPAREQGGAVAATYKSLVQETGY